MNLTITIFDEGKLSNDIRRYFYDRTDQVEEAMAHRFYEMTLSNFGIAGADRPLDWAPLSYRYSLKVGREIATLVVSGRLKNAVHQEGRFVEVSNAEVPYALAHQFGYGNLPARPYFPLSRDGECMPYTYGQVVEAGQNKMESIL